MKKSLVFLLCLGILLSVLPCCFADTTNNFTFRDGITWGMSEKEVLSLEQEQNPWFSRTNDGSFSMLQYDAIKVSTHQNTTLTYLFKNGMLYNAVYTLNGADESTAQYITQAMTSKYGEAGALGYDELVKFIEYIYHFMKTSGSPGAEGDFDPSVVSERLGVSEKDLPHIVLPGASWTLPDGTLILYTDQPLTQTPMLMYCSPENVNGYDTSGL